VVQRSYEHEQADGQTKETAETGREQQFNDRVEIWKEIIFLLPIIVGAAVVYMVCRHNDTVHGWWVNLLQYRAVAGFLGSLWGYYVGCGIVWATRILGTLGFGREAMGLGDVHLMGAAGAVIGPIPIVAAFFIAPFLGLAFVGIVMFFKKTRQIPYGPFLSLGILAAIILHDWIFGFLSVILYH